MKLVDLNVLLYAINRDAVHHRACHRWWEAALAGDEPVGLPWVVILGFLRVATHPRIFARPLRAEQAIERVEAWLAHPNVRLVREPEEQWGLLRQVLENVGTMGNLCTDAHLASLAIAHGATLVSCDAEFGRFAMLRVESPIASKRRRGSGRRSPT